jgi:hypothetical protein
MQKAISYGFLALTSFASLHSVAEHSVTEMNSMTLISPHEKRFTIELFNGGYLNSASFFKHHSINEVSKDLIEALEEANPEPSYSTDIIKFARDSRVIFINAASQNKFKFKKDHHHHFEPTANNLFTLTENGELTIHSKGRDVFTYLGDQYSVVVTDYHPRQAYVRLNIENDLERPDILMNHNLSIVLVSSGLLQQCRQPGANRYQLSFAHDVRLKPATFEPTRNENFELKEDGTLIVHNPEVSGFNNAYAIKVHIAGNAEQQIPAQEQLFFVVLRDYTQKKPLCDETYG